MFQKLRPAAALIAAMLLVAPAANASQLAAQIERALDQHPQATNIDVQVDGNAVVLDGKMDSRRDVDALVVAIARVPGVETIVNNIHTG